MSKFGAWAGTPRQATSPGTVSPSRPEPSAVGHGALGSAEAQPSDLGYGSAQVRGSAVQTAPLSSPPSSHGVAQVYLLGPSPAVETCYLVQPCRPGQDTYANLLQQVPDLVRSGQVPNYNASGHDAMRMGGAVPEAPMRAWGSSTRGYTRSGSGDFSAHLAQHMAGVKG